MQPIVTTNGLSKRFTRRLDYAEKLANLLGAGLSETTVHAVEDVDLTINPGEVVGLVGESGCGKSTLGRMVTGLVPPTEGEIRWQQGGLESGTARRQLRLFSQMIFQDPMSSLNPRKKVAQIIGEAPLLHGLVSRRDVDAYIVELMERVGLDASYRHRYPHQFSGGQRQRISIARALAVKPKLIVCDESVASLDVSIQAQILNQFLELKEELGLTYLFISHDLAVVKHISDRVVIMYLGRVVESAPAEEFFSRPNHPYTIALLREAPSTERRRQRFHPIEGEIPSPLNPPTGCAFHPRCPHAFDRCRRERPVLREIASGHLSACHLNDDTAGAAKGERTTQIVEREGK